MQVLADTVRAAAFPVGEDGSVALPEETTWRTTSFVVTVEAPDKEPVTVQPKIRHDTVSSGLFRLVSLELEEPLEPGAMVVLRAVDADGSVSDWSPLWEEEEEDEEDPPEDDSNFRKLAILAAAATACYCGSGYLHRRTSGSPATTRI